MDGKGFLLQNSNLFPQKIGKRLNRCHLTRSCHNLAEYERPVIKHSVSRTAAIEDGWEIRLLCIVTKSQNMTAKYLPVPGSFESQDKRLGVVQTLAFGKADVVCPGRRAQSTLGLARVHRHHKQLLVFTNALLCAVRFHVSQMDHYLPYLLPTALAMSCIAPSTVTLAAGYGGTNPKCPV
jgi:hypothetical protein